MPEFVDLFRAAIEGSLDAFVLLRTDRDGVDRVLDFIVIDANSRAETMFGLERNELLGKPIFETYRLDHDPGLRGKLARVVESRSPLEEEYRIDFRGEERWLQHAIVPVGDGLAVTIRDVTERRRAETHLRRVTDTVPGVVFQYRRWPDGREAFPFVSARCEEVLGLSPEEMASDPPRVWRRVHDDDRGAFLSSLRESEERLAPWRHEFRRYDADGKLRWLRGSAVPERSSDGSTTWTGFFSDATEAKSLEEQYFQAQKMESVGRLAGGVAHDFNNLLSAVLGFAELGSSHLADDHPLQANLRQIRHAAERGAALTRRLLAFARRQPSEVRDASLNVALAALHGILRPLIGEDIEIVEHLDPELHGVRIDLALFEQVVLNLAVNARDAMPEGGRLTLATSNRRLGEDAAAARGVAPGEFVELSVGDTGHGIPEEVRRHLFEPFFTTKGPDRGTGLGLATCYGIVKGCGGHIEVESEPGAGATFRVLFPSTGPVVASVEHLPRPEPVPVGDETILLVEDEPMVRRVAAQSLRAQGYEVIVASDGDEALRIVAGRIDALDLVLTDVVMPRMSGPALARALVARRPDLPVLFISGYTGGAELREVEGQPHELLEKPFTPGELARKVRQILDGQRSVKSTTT